MRFRLFNAVFPILVLISGAIISSCGSGGSSGSSGSDGSDGTASWTYMVYMAADNSLSAYGRDDVIEMETVGSNADVNVVVQADFDPLTSGVPDTAMRGRVVKDRNSTSMGSWYAEIGEQDMTDPATLTEFIQWAAMNYPAERYALVLWSHGLGWKDGSDRTVSYKGMITDNTSHPASYVMPLDDLSQAIRDGGVDFEVINFDACLMGMYEVAYEFRDTASYLTFSEASYPAFGDPYGDIIRDLEAAPSMGGLELAVAITNECLEFYTGSGYTVTKSAIDMAMMDRLHEDLGALAQSLIGIMEADGTQKDVIENLLADVTAYDENPATILDLGDFLQKLYDNMAAYPELQALIEAIIGNGTETGTLEQLVVANQVSNAGDTVNTGIAIYLLSSVIEFSSDRGEYAGLACSLPEEDVTWIDFLDSFLL